jgi:glycerol-3-phosphate dehydrogenase
MAEFKRDSALGALKNDTFDVLVIGGGITGAGILLDAASRGLKAALVEKNDFSSGTSSKSSKLIHGGLRYLAQKDYLLVYEALRERQLLLKNAGFLVSPLEFLIPIFGKDKFQAKRMEKLYSSALYLYDITGGFRIGKFHKSLNKSSALDFFPSLNPSLLYKGFIYYDAKADDSRLTLFVLRTAVELYDAIAVNYSALTGFIKNKAGMIEGAIIKPEDSDPFEVKANLIINATGVWADEIRSFDEKITNHSTTPARGIHIVIKPDKLKITGACVLPVLKDKRSIFVIPWENYIYIGTTDNYYEGDFSEIKIDNGDVDYLLEAVNTFINDKITYDDITGSWAGLRPLLSDKNLSSKTADISRRHKLIVSDSGLISIVGGKLTTYRKMAKDTLDLGLKRMGINAKKCVTSKLRLFAYLENPDRNDPLDRRFGTQKQKILELMRFDPSLKESAIGDLNYKNAEFVYSARYEMVYHLSDLLYRRTRAMLLNENSTRTAAKDIANLVAKDLGWNEQAVRQELEEFSKDLSK